MEMLVTAKKHNLSLKPLSHKNYGQFKEESFQGNVSNELAHTCSQRQEMVGVSIHVGNSLSEQRRVAKQQGWTSGHISPIGTFYIAK